MHNRAILLAASMGMMLAPVTLADDVAVINLAGVQLRHATNQSRSSSPDAIDPGYAYHYVVTGTARGTSGILALLFPSATPLAQILETLQPGSSSMLSGETYTPTGTHPVQVTSQRLDGSTVLLGTTVTAGATIAAGIDASHFAYFTITDVVMLPNTGFIQLGALLFVSGTATLTRLPAVPADMNGDGVVNNFDIDPFVLALTDLAAYEALYGRNPIYSGDVNRDGALDNFDIEPFVDCLTGGGC